MFVSPSSAVARGLDRICSELPSALTMPTSELLNSGYPQRSIAIFVPSGDQPSTRNEHEPPGSETLAAFATRAIEATMAASVASTPLFHSIAPRNLRRAV